MLVETSWNERLLLRKKYYTEPPRKENCLIEILVYHFLKINQTYLLIDKGLSSLF